MAKTKSSKGKPAPAQSSMFDDYVGVIKTNSKDAREQKATERPQRESYMVSEIGINKAYEDFGLEGMWKDAFHNKVK